METLMLILTIVGTLATVISTFIAVSAKNESKDILAEIKNEKNRNVSNSGHLKVENSGNNRGIVTGINTGEVSLK